MAVAIVTTAVHSCSSSKTPGESLAVRCDDGKRHALQSSSNVNTLASSLALKALPAIIVQAAGCSAANNNLQPLYRSYQTHHTKNICVNTATVHLRCFRLVCQDSKTMLHTAP